MSQQPKDIFDVLVALAQIVGAIATASALWVTYLTLRELKRQTDLANNPLLKLRFRWLPGLERRDANISNIARIAGIRPFETRMLPTRILQEHFDAKPYDDWRVIITKNLDQDLSGLNDSFLVIELSNVGKSEITQVTFDLELGVSMFEDSTIGYITPSQHKWSKTLTIDLDPTTTVYMPITNVRYFPVYTCRVSKLRYKDVRGKFYQDFDGSPTIEPKSNEILRPRTSNGGPKT